MIKSFYNNAYLENNSVLFIVSLIIIILIIILTIVFVYLELRKNRASK